MALTCKNCGGSIRYDAERKTITCESCGSSQAINSGLGMGEMIYESDDLTSASMNTYYRAVKMMSEATRIAELETAKSMFERISDVLNSSALVKECQDRIELLETEQKYKAALSNMQSDDPETVALAQKSFAQLGDYRDSVSKAEECAPLIKKAEEFQGKKAEREKREKARRNRKFKTIIVGIAIVIVAALLINSHIYSDSRYKIKITPIQEGYLSDWGGRYEFLYEVEIKNRGILDVSAMECEVIIEKKNDVIVDTSVSFSNYSSAAVRAGKSARFNWELKTDSEYVADELNNNFDDLDIKVKITQIQFTNGKLKTY